MTAERSTEIALARYTLILPLMREGSPRLKRQLRQGIAAKAQPFPDGPRRVSERSLYRWERLYRQGGFDALKPRPRRAAPSRAISVETLARAESLKREQPFRSARSIIRILQLDAENPLPEKQLSERTLRRHLAKRGATTALLTLTQSPKAYRRFERSAFGDPFGCAQGRLSGRVTPCTALTCLTRLTPTKNGRPSSSPSLTTTPASSPTPNSTGMSNCRVWKTASGAASLRQAQDKPALRRAPGYLR